MNSVIGASVIHPGQGQRDKFNMNFLFAGSASGCLPGPLPTNRPETFSNIDGDISNHDSGWIKSAKVLIEVMIRRISLLSVIVIPYSC